MASIAAALQDLLNESGMPLPAALDRHFADDYRQSTDGVWVDRAGFARQMAHLRTVVAHVEIRVLDEMTRGHAYAERHTITVTGRDGTTGGQEVFLFGRVGGDGRFVQLEELTRPLTPERGSD